MINVVIISICQRENNGVSRYTQMLEEGLYKYRKGVNVHKVFFDKNPELLSPEVDNCNDAIVIKIPFRLLQTDRFNTEPTFISIVDLVCSYFKGTKNIIWHVQSLVLIDFAVLLKKNIGGKTVAHVHVIPWKLFYDKDRDYFNSLYKRYENREYEYISMLDRYNYSACDSIICVSDYAKNYLFNVHKLDDKVKVIYNGIDLVSSVNHKKTKENSPPKILFVGRLSESKGIFELLDALKEVRARGFDFTLLMAGNCNGIIKEKIELLCGNNFTVELLGQVDFDKLCELYTTSDFGIIPSLHEQCSYVAIEMAMFGVPLIVSDVDALAELFEHDKTALKIPTTFNENEGLKLNRESLVESVIKMIEDVEFRRNIGVNVNKLYDEKFTLKTMIDKIINEYGKLIFN